MSDSDEVDYPPFGSYAFDQFVIEKWDVSSTQSRDEQKRLLVGRFIALGRYGRNVYFQRAWSEEWDSGITDKIPQDLCCKKDQYKIWELGASVLWIRTWYGDETHDTTGVSTSRIPSTITRVAADAYYKRLWQSAFLEDAEEDSNHKPEVDRALVNFIFDDDASAFGVLQDETLPDIVRVGEVPPFLQSVLRRCPDIIDGVSNFTWRKHDAETVAANQLRLRMSQRLLLMIADREACIQGWVYLVGVNHEGLVLPTRCRVRATGTQYYATEWFNEGVPLSEASVNEDEDIIVREDNVQGWDDW